MKRMPPALLSCCIAIAGCSSQDGLVRRLENPAPLHGDDAFTPLTELPEGRQAVVSEIPFHTYLKSMEAAYRQPEDALLVGKYVDAGIALSDAYCSRWFRRLDETQRRLSFAQNNFNVVRQLGTALIGVAGLSSDTTTVYGAVNTAIEGVNQNVNEAVFLAPDSGLVKQRVLQAMSDRASQLRATATRPRSFIDAYVELERYADMCSFVSARQFINQTVGAATATADPKTGEMQLLDIGSGAATAFQADHAIDVAKLIRAVDALDAAQAIELARQPPVQAPPGFRADLDITQEKGAKAFLRNLLVETSGNADDVASWQAALGH